MQTSTAKWQEDIDRTISDRMEVFVCR